MLYVVFALFFFLSAVPAYSAVFNIASGDVDGLIAAINASNANGEENTVNLAPGTYTLKGTDLRGPIISGSVRIQAVEDAPTIVDAGGQERRIFNVLTGGELTVVGLTLQGSNSPSGGAINNSGTLALYSTKFAGSGSPFGPGGIVNEAEGKVLIENSTIRNVFSQNGAVIVNFGSMTIRNSSIFSNDARSASGTIASSGHLEIVNSTVAKNTCFAACGAGGIGASGFVFITNSTIRENIAGGISGTIMLQNTIVAGNLNPPPLPPDCRGTIVSLGNNLIGNLRGCNINLQPSDLIGDPGLGDFIDDGGPGHGRYPVLATSRVINAGNKDACPPTDQLNTPRLGTCDIGAVEFYPVVNDLIAVSNIRTDFDATPATNAPAGTFHISVDFTNAGSEVIVNPFTEVVDLTNNDLLLNADGGSGGVGARVKFPDADSLFLPGATQTVTFEIGLQTPEPFNFFVNVLGERRSSTDVVDLSR